MLCSTELMVVGEALLVLVLKLGRRLDQKTSVVFIHEGIDLNIILFNGEGERW